MTGTLPTLLVVVAYLVAGLIVAVLLARRGQPPATVAVALVVWPFLVPNLAAAPASPAPAGGPCAERIDRVFDSLLETLEDPASDDVPWAAQALARRAALHQADTRLAFVDRVLADADDGTDGAAQSLREARAHAAAEVDAVLSAVAQLRLQVGLLALAGDAVPVQAQLESLMGRANALLEVHEAGYVAATA